MNRDILSPRIEAGASHSLRRSWRYSLVRWIGLVLLWATAVTQAADPALALEYKVKAGYLFNFARFVEWPAATLPLPDSDFVIGVLDSGEAVPVLQTLLVGRKLDQHPVRIQAVTADQIGKGLHILLVTRASGKSPEEIRQALGGAATLVVGETEEFAERGGVVGFIRDDDSIRFTLNLERAAEYGLKVSAKLSSVAKLVKSRRS